MKFIWSHIILRSCLTLALILQSLLPVSFAIAEGAGYDVSAFICSPSNMTPSAKAQIHIKNLMTLLDEDNSHEPPRAPNEHCSNCVISLNTVLTTPQKHLTVTNFSTSLTVYIFNLDGHVTLARGPPLGGRAPPKFL